jgi:hypothetical protein
MIDGMILDDTLVDHQADRTLNLCGRFQCAGLASGGASSVEWTRPVERHPNLDLIPPEQGDMIVVNQQTVGLNRVATKILLPEGEQVFEIDTMKLPRPGP